MKGISPDPVSLLRAMLLIRKFEEALVAHPDHGFQLLSSGQEAVSVGICAAMKNEDQILSSGRAIAPALARGLDPGTVMAELLGKVTGPNRGKAGRGHLADPDRGFFGAHAVVGGNLGVAAGVALAYQVERRAGIVVCLFGDGACGSGALHETMNIATLWKLPLVFVCDNNGLSVSTPPERALAPQRLSDLAAPFGIAASTADGMDVLSVCEAAARLMSHTRSGGGPTFLECLSERFAPHSTATRETRQPEKLAEIKGRCPIRRLSLKLATEGVLDDRARAGLEAEISAIVENALAFAHAAPYPDATEALNDVD